MPRWHELHRQIALAAIPCAAQGFASQATILLGATTVAGKPYSDAGMKTMKPMAGFKKAWLAVPRKDQGTMMKMCNDAAISKPHAAFCANVLALGGAN